MSRVISWFSCGAASAYATYLAHEKYGDKLEAVYCRVKEESKDNLRFLTEFIEKTGIHVKVIGDESMDYSIFKVFHSRKFRRKYQRHDDIQIFGYTIDEMSRVDRFIDSNNEVITDFILVEDQITKPDCMRWFNSMGFKLPEMYRLGYLNNNCIGCVKGGMGYWNAIRVEFKDAFDKMARTERLIGHALNKGKEGPVFLDELHPKRGNFKRDSPADCGFTCESKEILNVS